MRYLLDLVYLLILLLLSPWLIYQILTKPKYRGGLLDKLLGRTPTLLSSSRRAWFHGVSVGEIHLLRQVIAAFAILVLCGLGADQGARAEEARIAVDGNTRTYLIERPNTTRPSPTAASFASAISFAASRSMPRPWISPNATFSHTLSESNRAPD